MKTKRILKGLTAVLAAMFLMLPVIASADLLTIEKAPDESAPEEDGLLTTGVMDGLLTTGTADNTMTIGRILPSGSEAVTSDVLTEDAVRKLTEAAAAAAEKAEAQFYIVIRDAGDYDAEAIARQELVDRINNGGGYGEQHRAVIFFVNVNPTHRSFAIRKISEKDMNKMLSDGGDIRTELSNGNYYGAGEKFLSRAVSAMKPGFFQSIWAKLLAALGIGGAASGIAVGSHKTKARTKKSHYMKDGHVSVLSKEEHLTGTTFERKTPTQSGTDHQVDEKTHGGSNTF